MIKNKTIENWVHKPYYTNIILYQLTYLEREDEYATLDSEYSNLQFVSFKCFV